METRVSFNTRRAFLAAGCLFAVASAEAATGYHIDPEQAARIVPGMSASQVELALGPPLRRVRYGSQAGPTWVYSLLDIENPAFEIDFGGDGRVVSTVKRVDYSGDSD